MAIKFHCCPLTFLKQEQHPCWRVRSALDEKGIQYEIVKHPWMPRNRRKEVKRMTGDYKLPFIEFEDGRVLREDSKALAARIRAGQLQTQGAGAPIGD